MHRLLSAFRFFGAHAGGIVGECAKSALALARAEAYAQSQGWTCEWKWDDYRDNGPRDWGWSAADIARWDRSEHECLACILTDAEGRHRASLWGIWDPDRRCRRVVEAELALEAMAEEQRAWGQTAHAH